MLLNKSNKEMIERKVVGNPTDSNFAFFWELYVASFPAEERREYDYQVRTLGKKDYHLDILLKDSEPIGFIAWWDFRDVCYVEHFAISVEHRGQGYGEAALGDFIAQCQKPLLLEVEHPDSDINRRRIAFYERMGLHLTPHPYAHPSYHNPLAPMVSLRIMTHPTVITERQLSEFKEEAFQKIHFYQ